MKFSIIIPAYNVEKYIYSCCESVLTQDFDSSEFEVIVVDDCSPDKLGDEVKMLQSRYSNLRYYRHTINRRQGGARNTGLEMAKGDYVMFLDGDDCWIYSNVLSRLWEVLKDGDVDLLQSTSFKNVDERYNAEGVIAPPLSNLTCYSKEDFLCRERFSYSVCFSCFCKEIIDRLNLRFREHVVFEDSDWPIIYYSACKKIYTVDFPYYAYRHNPMSTLRKPRVSAFRDNIAGIISIYDFFTSGRFVVSESCARQCYNRLKNSIMSYILISRDYRIKDSLDCIRDLRRHPIMTMRLYDMSAKETVSFILLKYCPIGLIAPVRILTLTKRRILKWLKK